MTGSLSFDEASNALKQVLSDDNASLKSKLSALQAVLDHEDVRTALHDLASLDIEGSTPGMKSYNKAQEVRHHVGNSLIAVSIIPALLKKLETQPEAKIMTLGAMDIVQSSVIELATRPGMPLDDLAQSLDGHPHKAEMERAIAALRKLVATAAEVQPFMTSISSQSASATRG
ncbi:MAG: hypothetical protein SFT92_08350 [Rickettsiales bacterium]|nr:hypothetical protein [Rickettsiales bacterium]